jgi:dipeptide/tripeptide permease
LASTHHVASALTAGYRAAFAIAGGGLVIGALLALALPKLSAATASQPVVALEEVLEEAGEPQVAFEG